MLQVSDRLLTAIARAAAAAQSRKVDSPGTRGARGNVESLAIEYAAVVSLYLKAIRKNVPRPGKSASQAPRPVRGGIVRPITLR